MNIYIYIYIVNLLMLPKLAQNKCSGPLEKGQNQISVHEILSTSHKHLLTKRAEN